ncbi:M23 family metallopeptidase [Sporolactobacillus vineae]|uniref:M23 family metallopeptidase n=1 Tax=Sporolactobacillus vineae TaxID=444463 RepID=UPI00028A065F|nr:M23 family metallopeptidase [Sporolactobacillus vineae]
MNRVSKMMFCLMTFFFAYSGFADAEHSDPVTPADQRKSLYLKTAALTGVDWAMLAACDQYARNITASVNRPEHRPLISLTSTDRDWAGLFNIRLHDQDPVSIDFFGGTGKDGNGDGKADPKNPEDALLAFAEQLAAFGPGEENTRIAIWNYFHRGKAVELIEENAAIFRKFNTVNLTGYAFPLPLTANYDYEPTWGARRGWGGLRIHEGTDLFADYGTPVRATAYGVIEMKGWNKYGGWRIGLRDLQGNYHYFAHLNGYAPHLKKGTVTSPGQIIGYVGSSGYGPKGTMGKFPPHLHYGLYHDNGVSEYSIDPYPSLRLWENQERLKRR